LHELSKKLQVGWSDAYQSPPQSDKASQIVALVEKAAALVESKGKSAFTELRKSTSPLLGGNTSLFVGDINNVSMSAFHYHLSATCLFVGSMNGVSLLNAGFPKLEGTKILDIEDSKGKRIYVAYMQMAQSNGSGWVDYMWPKPGQNQPSQKWTYVKAVRLDGTPAYIGAGFYPD
jgi:cytochrome c